MDRRSVAAAFAVVLACLVWSTAAWAQQPGAGDFQKVTLDDNTQNPMELDIAPDGRVFYIERDGRLMIWKPNTQQTVTAGTVPVTRSQENGLLGLTLAPDFAFSKWVYLFYSQLPDNTNTQVIARFKVNGDTLDMASEQKVLTFTHQRGQCCHSGGSMYFGPDGSLFIATGDNTNPFDSSGYTPIDERSGRSAWDAQRTSANTNDLNGKILRIKPMEIPLGAPGVGTTYTIPAGNLFPASGQTRPEIYGMGFRNPFRITVDQTTGWVLSADYGPDAGTTNANRGPQGSVEYNVLPSAGNYGWPYCIRENTAYNDYNFDTSQSGATFDCANPVNDSPNNTGLTVKDQVGLTGVENILITVGNRAPVVTIETPPDGKLASYTDKIPYKISVTDPEDGTTGSGISCNDLAIKVQLGHDEHAHDLSSATGCEGVASTGLTSGHGPEANTFTVISVTYTDKGGQGGIVPLTGRAEAVLQPKSKQAEFFAATGRAPNGTAGGTPAVQTENSSDSDGGGQNIGFIEDGDYTVYRPFNLTDISEARFRVASAGPGGTIELRYDSPTGPLLGKTAMITPTGNWQTYKNVALPLTNVPAGTHDLYVITRNPGQTASLLNMNWIDFVGKGAAQTAAPEVSATATPATGAAPLPVAFDSTASDPDGGTLAYAWDFGVPGTTTDTSTAADPTYTYANQGNYTATLTVTDGQGGTTVKTFAIRVTAPAGCGTSYRDDFDGADLGTGWEVVRRDPR